MIRTEFMAALNQVCSERGIEPEQVLETLKHAILAAYRKDYGNPDDIVAEIDKDTGEVKLLKNGEDVTPPGFGRIAAQTAKQVILQGVREAEKTAVLVEFSKKVGTLISGMLQRREGDTWIVDIGRTVGLLTPEEQIPSENYRQNQRMKFYLKEIKEKDGKSGIILSRTDPELVKLLFEMEVPEIVSGSVEIKNVAREPGSRSKVAVSSNQEKVDPVGSCVGQRGVRVQAVTNELGGERMDIIVWNEDAAKFIAAALSPAKVTDISVNKKKRKAKVEVPEDQLSLAIGKGGQNARLAAKLTGFSIDIKGEKEGKEGEEGGEAPEPPKAVATVAGELSELGLSKRVVNVLSKAGITTVEKLKKLSSEELSEIKGVGKKAVEEIKKQLKD
ncbi:MAG: transcription termination/antitermination protein NusA [Candidatus Cloacimonetes bacterium]|nr:transcription termination/antitermination protein NusA [Candidatus Cloacimonadota bacterium]